MLDRMARGDDSGAIISRYATTGSDAGWGGNVPARRVRRDLARGQWTRRTNPQIGQRAVFVSGSSSRKEVQPLVLQYRRPAATLVRRRMRRMAEARPVMDDVAERDIMVILAFVLSGAP
jgi:hypothetical protein